LAQDVTVSYQLNERKHYANMVGWAKAAQIYKDQILGGTSTPKSLDAITKYQAAVQVAIDNGQDLDLVMRRLNELKAELLVEAKGVGKGKGCATSTPHSGKGQPKGRATSTPHSGKGRRGKGGAPTSNTTTLRFAEIVLPPPPQPVVVMMPVLVPLAPPPIPQREVPSKVDGFEPARGRPDMRAQLQAQLCKSHQVQMNAEYDQWLASGES
jgi:hypothetical protein